MPGTLALLWRLRDRLRSGEVWVAASRRYGDPRDLRYRL